MGNLYFFYGEEEYLKEYYADEVKKQVVAGDFADFNEERFIGKNFEMMSLKNAVESMPMMAEKKLIVLRDSGLFKAEASAQKESLEALLQNLPDTVCFVIMEKEVDQRGRLYKLVKKRGLVVEFKYQKTADLLAWVARVSGASKKKMEKEDIYYLLEHCDAGMMSLKNELEKLIDFCKNKTMMTKADIDQVCTKSLESRVFKMIDALMAKEQQLVFQYMREIQALKEPGIKILTLLYRHFSSVLRAKLLLEEGLPASGIASTLGIAPFIAERYARQSRHLTLKHLHNAIKSCARIDVQIKSGKGNDWVEIELFFAEFGADFGTGS